MDEFVGRTVGQILTEVNTDYSAVKLIDEPPGKLWGIEVPLQKEGSPNRVFLELEPSPALFSQSRAWPQTLVEQQKVSRVHTSHTNLF